MQILKKMSVFLFVVGAVATMLLAGCGGGAKSTGTGNGALQVANSSSYPIVGAYVVLSTSTTWGSNLIASSVAAGGSWTLSDLAPGTYDAYFASVGDGTTYYNTIYNFEIPAGSSYYHMVTELGYTGSLNVTNNSTSPITELYISTTYAGDGISWLVSGLSSATSIPSPGSVVVRDIPKGTYIVRAVHGTNSDIYNVVISSHTLTSISIN